MTLPPNCLFNFRGGRRTAADKPGEAKNQKHNLYFSAYRDTDKNIYGSDYKEKLTLFTATNGNKNVEMTGVILRFILSFA